MEQWGKAITGEADLSSATPNSVLIGDSISMSTLVSQGIQHLNSGQPEDAEICFRAALQQQPEDTDALYQLGSLCFRSDRINEAKSLIESVLRIDPLHAKALCGLGAIHHCQGDLSEAIDCFTRSASIQPTNADTQTNLALALREKGLEAEAVQCLKLALELNPQHGNAARLMGLIEGEKGRYASALNHLSIAREADPLNIDFLLDLGLLSRKAKDSTRAYSSYVRILDIDPDNALAHLYISLIFLQTGETVLGWELYEWRLHESLPSPLLIIPKGERWDGSHNKSLKLLLISEQGLGDVLQFIRLAPILREQAGHVALCTQRTLIPLIEQSGLVDQLYDPSEAASLDDYQWLPLLSIPRLLCLQDRIAETFNSPYLKACSASSAHWKTKLSASQSLLVGLHWQGNPAAEHGLLAGRSLPLELLAPLADLRGLEFISLQKGAGSEQLETCSFRRAFVNAQKEVSEEMSFVETAAVLEQCDIVITTDTALAHLSGSLGRPTWLMLQQVPDWRWGLRGEQTHWYPSMRLFRQRRPNDWQEVINRVQRALRELLETRPHP